MVEVEIQHTSSGKSLKKREIITADKTGSINLTIWEGAINEIALGKCYKMKHLRMEPCQRFYRQWVAVVLEVVK